MGLPYELFFTDLEEKLSSPAKHWKLQQHPCFHFRGQCLLEAADWVDDSSFGVYWHSFGFGLLLQELVPITSRYLSRNLCLQRGLNITSSTAVQCVVQSSGFGLILWKLIPIPYKLLSRTAVYGGVNMTRRTAVRCIVQSPGAMT